MKFLFSFIVLKLYKHFKLSEEAEDNYNPFVLFTGKNIVI